MINKTFREENGILIKGIIIPAIIDNFNFWLTEIVISRKIEININIFEAFSRFSDAFNSFIFVIISVSFFVTAIFESIAHNVPAALLSGF